MYARSEIEYIHVCIYMLYIYIKNTISILTRIWIDADMGSTVSLKYIYILQINHMLVYDCNRYICNSMHASSFQRTMNLIELESGKFTVVIIGCPTYKTR